MVKKTTGAAVAALLALSLLAGCGSDEGATGSTGSTGSVTPDPSATPTMEASLPVEPESPSGSPSESAPAVEPATGPLVEQTSASLHAPAGWEYDEGLVASQNGAYDSAGRGLITFYDRPSLQTASLDDQVISALKVRKDEKLERLPDVVLDGDPAYRLGGTCSGEPCEYVGVQRNGRDIRLSFTLPSPDLGETARNTLVESVLASFVWKS